MTPLECEIIVGSIPAGAISRKGGSIWGMSVKGRIQGATTVTVTKNEVLTSLNKPDDYILAIVEFQNGWTDSVHYIRKPFRREPDFGVTSVNYDLPELLARAEVPS